MLVLSIFSCLVGIIRFDIGRWRIDGRPGLSEGALGATRGYNSGSIPGDSRGSHWDRRARGGTDSEMAVVVRLQCNVGRKGNMVST